MRLETRAIHAGRGIDPATGAVSQPIHLTTTFERAPDGSFPSGLIYAREGNPNRNGLEECLAGLEGGEAAISFASGMAAIHAVFQSLRPGDHVIAPNDIYYGTKALLRDTFAGWGLRSTFVDMTDLAELRSAVQPETKLIWAETPSNPTLKITDLAGVIAIAREAGALTAIDNTWPTPLLTRPLELGADLVMHSTTKYFGGHCDITGGAIVARTKAGIAERIRTHQGRSGAIPSPFDCWLLLRGLATFPVRMRAHCEGAATVAAALNGHPQLTRVHYPGLATHPGHAIAARQMSLFGGMLAIEVAGGAEPAMQAAARLKLITRATSLGGVHTLIEHRKSIEGPESPTPDGLLRISIGLEHPQDLMEDLLQALG